MAAGVESGALLESPPGNSEVTIEFDGWRRRVKEHADSGESLGQVWASMPRIDGDAAQLQETQPHGADPGPGEGGGAAGAPCFLVRHFPFGACALLLMPCFPLGFACGLNAQWADIYPMFFFVTPFVLATGMPIGFEGALLAWNLAVWLAWGYLLAAPLLLLVWYAIGEQVMLACVANILIIALTMPVHISAMKVWNFRWAARGEICKLMGITYQMAVPVAGFILFILVDWAVLKHNWADPLVARAHSVLRPFTVFLAKRVGYGVVMGALGRHPSPTFRVTWLFSSHIALNVMGVSAICKSKTWMDLLYFVTVDTVMKLLGLYCFTLAGTETLKNYRVLQCIHTVLTKGKPVPFPGMVKGQYRAIEIFVQTISMISLLLGLIATYFVTLLLPQAKYKPALLFWYPAGGYTVVFLCVLLLREVAYEAVMHRVTAWKTHADYRQLFGAWLRADSMVGWHQILLAGLTCAFFVSYLTNITYGFAFLLQLENQG